MKCTLAKGIAAVPLFFLLTHLFAAENPVLIRESEIHATILEKEITVAVPVSNNSSSTVSGDLKIELLDPGDIILTSNTSASKFKPGKNSVTVHLFPQDKINSDKILWYRLRYTLQDNEKPLSKGIVALGAVTPGMFELRIAHAENALPGKPYHVLFQSSLFHLCSCPSAHKYENYCLSPTLMCGEPIVTFVEPI